MAPRAALHLRPLSFASKTPQKCGASPPQISGAFSKAPPIYESGQRFTREWLRGYICKCELDILETCLDGLRFLAAFATSNDCEFQPKIHARSRSSAGVRSHACAFLSRLPCHRALSWRRPQTPNTWLLTFASNPGCTSDRRGPLRCGAVYRFCLASFFRWAPSENEIELQEILAGTLVAHLSDAGGLSRSGRERQSDQSSRRFDKPFAPQCRRWCSAGISLACFLGGRH